MLFPRFFRLWPALAACACSGAEPPSLPERVDQSRAAIVGGQTTSEFDSVVFLLNEGYGCTGVVVAPQVVLTAGHCIDGVSGEVDVYWADDYRHDGAWAEQHSTDSHLHPQFDAALAIVITIVAVLPIALDEGRHPVSRIVAFLTLPRPRLG